MCPLLQVSGWSTGTLRSAEKLLVCPNFDISAEANWGVMLSPVHGERAPRAEACPGGQCPGT